MKKLAYLLLIGIFIGSCSNEAIDFNNTGLNDAELVPKKLTYNIWDIEDSLEYNEFGNLVVNNAEIGFTQNNYIYNESQQITLFSSLSGFDTFGGVMFNYGSGETANEIISIDDCITINRMDNKITANNECPLEYPYTTEFVFKTNNRKLLEQYTSQGFRLNFYYDGENNPILMESYLYNETTSTYELEYKVEQTFDDKHNFLKNAGYQDIVASLYLKRTENFDPINRDNELIYVMNQFAPNNLLTQKITYSNGFNFTYSFDYMYNEDNYPTSGTRTEDDAVRTYTFEYY